MSLRFFGFHDSVSEGKFLWEILTQLRGLGVGRCVTKSEWMRRWPDQPSYMRIVKARPTMDRWLQEGSLWADWTFRGKHLGVYEFGTDLNRSDWVLIHKHEEKKFTENRQQMGTLNIPSTFPVPPLQQLLSKKWAEKCGGSEAAVHHKKRAPLDVCLDPNFEMYRKFIKRVEPKKMSDSIYDEIDPGVFLDLYGRMLPTKIDAWSPDPEVVQYRFSRQTFEEFEEDE
ncbi:hypothetical protein niasHS_007148 [Heterodera schachtii]|uniref:Uncharacterized protein n=1 Tax=Heterodera schachtii TaxID=97005 RepID=A0ABD2JL58_HETSC